MTIVLIPSTGELPDVFTSVVQQLDQPKIFAAQGRLATQIKECEKFLDKHELRHSVVFACRGTGAFVAQAIKQASPNRVAAIVALGYPHAALKLPSFVFRDKKLVPQHIPVVHVADEAQMLQVLAREDFRQS
ncbi:MAG: hypothetical protein Q4A31_01910 [Corynebacterium sp.]|uniref:hypothetical protein n=1 Tax=Corynebacterium sp. TaxID=1720 RepID=UPI0026DA8A4F|nr:hypothetical protein [Corynebacterium sp.]MDO4760661.1 hypothetical protein [Corynebacterium sp.]